MPIWTTPQALTFTGLTTEDGTTTSSYDTSTSPLNITIGDGLTGTKTKTDDKNFTLAVTAATDTALGGIQTGYKTDGTNRNYAVELSNNQAYVNVPWTNTTYTPGSGIAISGTEISSSYSWYIVDPSIYDNADGSLLTNNGPCFTVLVNTSDSQYDTPLKVLGTLAPKTNYTFFGYAESKTATSALTSWPTSGAKIYTLNKK